MDGMDTKRKLIEQIKVHRELYNTSLAEYKDIATRNDAWKQVSEALEIPVEECKSDWMKLRNSYVNALRRRVSLQNREGRILPPWLYEKEMSFLKPFMTGRGWDDTPYTVLLPEHFSIDPDPSANNDEIPIILERKRKRPKTPIDTLIYDREDASIKEDDVIKLTTKERKQKKLLTPKIEVDNAYEILDSTDILDNSETFSLKPRKNYQDIINDMDESDLFFLGLSQTLKKLPKLEQCRLKMDIFKIMNNAEMNMLESERKRRRRSSSD